MSTLADRQIELVQKFDDEMLYWLDGVVSKMHVSGVGEKLDHFRKGREPNRPPCVTLEPRRNGQLMLGLVVSRPRNGRFVYDTVLGHWDLSVPIRPHGLLNENKPRHRRVASWGLQLLRGLLEYGRRVKNNEPRTLAMAMPRVLVPFNSGEERIDPSKRAEHPDALVDYQSVGGKTLIDAKIAYRADTARAIDNDEVFEDFRPVMGQCVPNPFRHAKEIRSADGTKMIPLSRINSAASEDILAAARRFIGRGLESGATDTDIVLAANAPDQNMFLRGTLGTARAVCWARTPARELAYA
ncbi:hypothetical protein EBZ39_04485 [bacterium]|nr:hypothetical protein [bacterium]